MPRMIKAQPLGWWGESWLAYLRQWFGIALTGPQMRGARMGPATITFGRGQIAAEVPYGSYGSQATAAVRVRPLGQRDWRRALDAVAANVDMAHRLLSGKIGPELRDCFAAAGVTLFPKPWGRYGLRCSCRQRGVCRHLKVLALRAAYLLDGNPFLWFTVLGMPRDEVFAYVRPRLGGHNEAALAVAGLLAPGAGAGPGDWAGPGAGAAPGAALSLDPERFWVGAADPDAVAIRPAAGEAPDALLRSLGPLPLSRLAGTVEMLPVDLPAGPEFRLDCPAGTPQPLADVLVYYVTRVAGAARALVAGDSPPIHPVAGDSPPIHPAAELPGKPVPPGPRLATEVAEAVRAAGEPLTVDDLHRLCPTAAAMPPPHHRRYLAAAFPDLPPDLVVLARRCVATRGAVLAGQAFCHVVTFADWYRRQLGPDADWIRALAAAGLNPPYTLRPDPFADLQAEVGDALWLTLPDPGQPLLAVRLVRRTQRGEAGDEAERAAANAEAGVELRRHILDLGATALTEAEAVALLLATRQYRTDRNPDPLWLLPLLVPELHYDPRGLQHGQRGVSLTPGRWPWLPTFGRARAGHWAHRDQNLGWLPAFLGRAGWAGEAIEQALTVAQSWSRYWPGPQDGSRPVPPVAALLDFLWNVAPVQARARRIPAETVTAGLQTWFRLLVERRPELGSRYAPHLAACGLTAAYAHRQETLPPAGRNGEDSRSGWRGEGYRWIGPEGFFD